LISQYRPLSHPSHHSTTNARLDPSLPQARYRNDQPITAIAAATQPARTNPPSIRSTHPDFVLETPEGARVTPNLAQELLLQYCARLPGADK